MWDCKLKLAPDITFVCSILKIFDATMSKYVLHSEGCIVNREWFLDADVVTEYQKDIDYALVTEMSSSSWGLLSDSTGAVWGGIPATDAWQLRVVCVRVCSV